MALTLTFTRRSAVLGVATTFAIGGAFLIGLSGENATPKAGASIAPYAAGDTSALGSDAFPGITVQGVGQVTGTPDTLILDLAVSKTAPDVSTAVTQLSGTMTAVQNSFTSHGVAAADVKTSGLSVNPQYDYTNNKQTLAGYNATESLTVQLRDIKGAGAEISAATDAGGDSVRINGLSTDLQNNSALLNAARDAAFADAKAKATQYAKSAGRTLGAVVRVEEGVSSPPQQLYADSTPAAAKSSGTAPVPIQVGSSNLSVTVTVVFAFA